MTNRKTRRTEIEKICVRLGIYSDVCKHFLKPEEWEGINWFFRDIHNRLADMFKLKMGGWEFFKYSGEVYKELDELTEVKKVVKP